MSGVVLTKISTTLVSHPRSLQCSLEPRYYEGVCSYAAVVTPTQIPNSGCTRPNIMLADDKGFTSSEKLWECFKSIR